MHLRCAGIEVICPYCQNIAELTSSAIVYNGRDYGPIYLCKCVDGWAYVGCHKGTIEPLGRLADRELRKWKKKAHAAFDPLWKYCGMQRNEAYQWLADKLSIPRDQCHIGMFNIEMCQKVVAACEGYLNE